MKSGNFNVRGTGKGEGKRSVTKSTKGEGRAAERLGLTGEASSTAKSPVCEGRGKKQGKGHVAK